MQIKCFLENNGRIRNVKMGPVGKIYISALAGGRLYLYVPNSIGLACEQKKNTVYIKINSVFLFWW
jgi:hypothetical protein